MYSEEQNRSDQEHRNGEGKKKKKERSYVLPEMRIGPWLSHSNFSRKTGPQLTGEQPRVPATSSCVKIWSTGVVHQGRAGVGRWKGRGGVMALDRRRQWIYWDKCSLLSRIIHESDVPLTLWSDFKSDMVSISHRKSDTIVRSSGGSTSSSCLLQATHTMSLVGGNEFGPLLDLICVRKLVEVRGSRIA